MFALMQSTFRNLFGLRIVLFYPRPRQIFPPPPLSFPHLRTLFFHLVSNDITEANVERNTFSQWSFPCLEIFHLTHEGRNLRLDTDDLMDMLQTHAGTLRELAITRIDAHELDISSLWAPPNAIGTLPICISGALYRRILTLGATDDAAYAPHLCALGGG